MIIIQYCIETQAYNQIPSITIWHHTLFISDLGDLNDLGSLPMVGNRFRVSTDLKMALNEIFEIFYTIDILVYTVIGDKWELGIYIHEISYVNYQNLLVPKLMIREIISIYIFQFKIIKRFLRKKRCHRKDQY